MNLTDIEITEFRDEVLEVARACQTGRFGDNKVFINHVWRRYNQMYWEYSMSLPEFKELLVTHMRGDLSRADLVSVMDAEDVEESEACYLNARYNFINKGSKYERFIKI